MFTIIKRREGGWNAFYRGRRMLIRPSDAETEEQARAFAIRFFGIPTRSQSAVTVNPTFLESAKSPEQQRFFGKVLAFKRGEIGENDVDSEIKKAAENMTTDQIKKYAGTKHSEIKDSINKDMSTIEKLVLEKFKEKIGEEKNEYQKFFAKKLDNEDKSIPDMSDEEKKDFFNRVSKEWEKVKKDKNLDEKTFKENALKKFKKEKKKYSELNKEEFFASLNESKKEDIVLHNVPALKRDLALNDPNDRISKLEKEFGVKFFPDRRTKNPIVSGDKKDIIRMLQSRTLNFSKADIKNTWPELMEAFMTERGEVSYTITSGKFKGWTYHAEEDREDDNVKIFHTIKDPRGKEVKFDFTPYEELSKRNFERWLELGQPTAQDVGKRSNINNRDIENLARKKNLKESSDIEGWAAVYRGKRIEIEKSKFVDTEEKAKQQAIRQLKVPKNDLRRLTIVPMLKESFGVYDNLALNHRKEKEPYTNRVDDTSRYLNKLNTSEKENLEPRAKGEKTFKSFHDLVVDVIDNPSASYKTIKQ